MRRIAVVVLAVLSLVAVTAVDASARSTAAKHRADGKLGDWRGKPTMIAGRTTTHRGEYIYTDWLYDDYGPDLDGKFNPPAFRSQLAPTRGDYRYPDDAARYGHNAADLRELRVAADDKRLYFLIALQTMKRADAAVVQIALDTDRKAATSAKDGKWPAGSGIVTRGPEHFITTAGNSARLVGPKGTRSVTSVANTAQNAIEIAVPRKALGKLTKRPGIRVVTGLNDGKGAFAPQEGPVAAFNAGFRKFEEYSEPGFDQDRLMGSWSEKRQSAALASGDLSAFGGSFNTGRLRRGESNRPKPLPPGKWVRIFRSKKDYGEGIDLKGGNGPGGGEPNIGGNPSPEFRSRYQPYALYLPKNYRPKQPNVLTLNGHSLDINHLEYYSVTPIQLAQLGDQRRSIIVTPLSRGTDTWFIDAGLIDTIEAWNDARRHYRIDDDRTFITGYSMGGYMTYRLGLLMPDRFSKASVYVGPPAYQLWPYPLPPQPGGRLTEIGNTNKIVENALNLPYEINHGNADELVPVEGVQHQADTFRDAGNEYAFYRHSANDHFAFIFADDWARTRDFLGTAPRQENPIEVRFRRYPAMDLPTGGLRFDSAYWVSGIQVRGSQKDTANSGRVRAVTHGLGGRLKKVEADLPQAVPGPVSPGTRTGQRHIPGAGVGKGNTLELDLDNVSGATFALKRAGLTLMQDLKLQVDTTAPAVLVLRGRYSKLKVEGATLSKLAGGVKLTVPAGKRTLTLRAG